MTQVLRRFVKTPATHSTLAQAYRTFRKECGDPQADHSITLSIHRGDEQWEFDRVEEFLELYATGPCHAVLKDESPAGFFSFRDEWDSGEVTVRLDSLTAVQRTIRTLDSGRADRKPFKVFVGHGRDPLWHALVSHLRDLHDFRVFTYESIAEFGQPATQVLDLAAQFASVAILVHTAEIQANGGDWQAVPNVIYETGFFSAHLGSDKALVLREDRCRQFTDIAGLTELRFSNGNIREVFGDVVAMLRRHSKE